MSGLVNTPYSNICCYNGLVLDEEMPRHTKPMTPQNGRETSPHGYVARNACPARRQLYKLVTSVEYTPIV